MSPVFGTIVETTRPRATLDALAAHAEPLRGALRDSGAILLRGFEFDLGGFEALCSLFGTRTVVHPGISHGGRFPVSEETATVDAGTSAFPWHAELAYAPGRPDLVAFACERPATHAGQTMLSDGCAIADRLSDAARAVALRRVRYRYTRPAPMWPAAFAGARTPAEVERALRARSSGLRSGEELTWSFSRRRARGVRIEFTTPMLSRTRWGDRLAFCNHVIWQERRRREQPRHPLDVRRFVWPPDGATLADGSPIPADGLAEFERAADEVAYAVEWRRGDVALLDNSRIMHAREAVQDRSRRILARISDAAF